MSAIIHRASGALVPLVLAFQSDTDDLFEACTSRPSTACRVAFELTGSDSLARLADDIAANALRVLFIIIIAWLARWFVRRHSPRVIRLLLERQDAATKAIVARTETQLDEQQKIERELRRERARQRANTLGNVITSIIGVMIVFIAALMILDQIGVNLAPLIASAGIAGIALGFGAQQLVRDYLAGIFIIVEDEFGVGDVVDTGHATGTVERMTLRMTQLRDVNGTVWYVPNGEIQRTGNLSQLWSRAVLDIDVSYDTDIEQAAEILLETARRFRDEDIPDHTIIADPEFWGVEAFGADGVTLRLVLRTEPLEQWNIARALRGRIKRAFDEAGIEIPFPQRTVWHHTVTDASDQSGAPPATAEEEDRA